jgi:type I restriction enzyme M protein
MIGAIVGDIVGSKYEWEYFKSKDFEFLDPDKCSFTDDSVMTIAVAAALADWKKNGGDLSTLAIKRMQEFGRRFPYAGYGGKFDQWLNAENPQPYNSWSNGAAMRVSACGWAANSVEEAVALSDAVTAVTHNHAEGLKGAAVTAVCVYLARTGVSKDEIRRHVEENYYKIDFTLDEIRPTYDFDVSCQGSVPQALESFFESVSFEDAIRNAVSIGGDSDTIAAITGAVAGAYYGVPDDIRHMVMYYLDTFLEKAFIRAERLIKSKTTLKEVK